MKILLMFIIAFSTSGFSIENNKDKKPITGRAPASVYSKVITEAQSGAVFRIWDEEFQTVCYSVHGHYNSGNGAGSGTAIQCLNTKKQPGGDPVSVIMQLDENRIARIWDEELKIVCYISQGQYNSGNGAGSNAAIHCLQR
jgi:hypothetical protein